MGATDFVTEAEGDTAAAAFKAAVDRARYLYGHAGYTGTIAEKDDFATVTVPQGIDTHHFIAAALNGEVIEGCEKELARAEEVIDDKWGPAACVQTGPRTFVFF